MCHLETGLWISMAYCSQDGWWAQWGDHHECSSENMAGTWDRTSVDDGCSQSIPRCHQLRSASDLCHGSMAGGLSTSPSPSCSSCDAPYWWSTGSTGSTTCPPNIWHGTCSMGILHRCYRARTHTCSMWRNGHQIHGAYQVLLEHADFLHIEAYPAGSNFAESHMLPVYDDQIPELSSGDSLWPGAPLYRSGTVVTSSHTVQVPRQSRSRSRTTGLHEEFWIYNAVAAWIGAFCIMLTLPAEHRPGQRRRRRKVRKTRTCTTLLLIGLIMMQHYIPCVQALQRQWDTTETMYGRHQHGTLWARPPLQGLPPPGNPHPETTKWLSTTSCGQDLQEWICNFLSYKHHHGHIWTALRSIRNVPTPVRAGRNSCARQISLQDALFGPEKDLQFHPIDKPTVLEKESNGPQEAPLPTSEEGGSFAPDNSNSIEVSKVFLGKDVMDDDDGLFSEWDPLPSRSPLSFLPDLPSDFATHLHRNATEPLHNYEHLHVYTDGSAYRQDGENYSAWAFIVFASHQAEAVPSQLFYVDWFGAPTQDDPLHHQWVGAMYHCSRSGEGEAISWALMWLMQRGTSQQVHLHSDATSVLFAATGDWTFAEDDQLLRRTRSLFHLLWTVIGDNLRGHHVPAHTGVYGNEIVDLLAKAICQGTEPPRIPGVSLSTWMHGDPPLIEWAWAMVDPMHRLEAVPYYKDGFLQWTNWKPAEKYFDWLPRITEPAFSTEATHSFNWKFIGYNVGSIKETARVPFLRQQLRFFNIHVAGLQETRSSYSEVVDTSHLRFISPASQGIGGCELWIATDIPVFYHDDELVYFSRKQFQVVFTDPQILIVNATIHNRAFTLVVAHAPHSGKGQVEVETWWKSYTKHVQAFSSGRQTVVFIDANAQPVCDPPHTGDLCASDTNYCGQVFNGFLRDCGLFLPSTFAQFHQGHHDT